MKQITRAVWIVSLISLFTDTASEMLYPIMPLYLKQIGFSIVLIGILEGLAEATAGLSKGYFGKQSDLTGKRTPFVQMGYALSAISKPMLAIFAYPIWIFLSRTLDRLGKGIRTGARDAILSAEATPENKARVFGFHRSMDTLGAVFGPALALVYLYYYPTDYVHLFLIAFLPGVLAVITSLFLKKDRAAVAKKTGGKGFFSFLTYWKTSEPDYRKLLIGLLAFALINSSDVFLILGLKQSGLDDTSVIGIYIFYNLIYALCAFPLGILADRLGIKNTFVFGLCAFAVVYFGFAFFDQYIIYVLLFILYGIYGAATEGISKAWITTISKSSETATAIGTYTALQSICAMIASSFTGIIWYTYGATTAFLFSAITTALVIVYFITIPPPKRIAKPQPANPINPQPV